MRIRAQICLIVACVLVLGTAGICLANHMENEPPDCLYGIERMLRIASWDTRGYGMENVDFDSLSLSERVSVYEKIDGEPVLQDYGYYLILDSQGRVVASAAVNQDGSMTFGSSFVNQFNVCLKLGKQFFSIVRADGKTYIKTGNEFYPMLGPETAVTTPVEDRDLSAFYRSSGPGTRVTAVWPIPLGSKHNEIYKFIQ